MPDAVDPSESQKESNAEPSPNGAAEESSKKVEVDPYAQAIHEEPDPLKLSICDAQLLVAAI